MTQDKIIPLPDEKPSKESSEFTAAAAQPTQSSEETPPTEQPEQKRTPKVTRFVYTSTWVP